MRRLSRRRKPGVARVAGTARSDTGTWASLRLEGRRVKEPLWP